MSKKLQPQPLNVQVIPLPASLVKFAKSKMGDEMAKWLAENLLVLNSLDGIDFSDERKAAIIGEGRTQAIAFLNSLLSTLLTNKEGITIKDERDDYSLNVD